MAMRSSTSPRCVYVRAGSPIVCYGGLYFGPPANKKTKIDAEKEVTIEVLEKSGGKARIAVTQKVGKNKVTETWNEKHLTFEKRTAAAE
jgi:hypothetical protein